MELHEWKDADGNTCTLDSQGRFFEDFGEGPQEIFETTDFAAIAAEILRLAQEDRELKAERDEAISHATAMPNDLTGFGEERDRLAEEMAELRASERRRTIDLVETLHDQVLDATGPLDLSDVTAILDPFNAKLAELRAEEEK